jgi:inositol phosphorylceramide mannosyltransferase catalytic subunit
LRTQTLTIFRSLLLTLFLSFPFSLFSESSIENVKDHFGPWPAEYTKGTKNGHWSMEIKTSRKLFKEYRSGTFRQDTWLIPPIIHFVWLGSPLPAPRQEIIDTWRRLHPSWKIKVWTDDEAKAFPFRNLKAFEAAKNYGEKADIFRYEILFLYGGVYADTDVECLRPFDILCKSCDFFSGLSADHFLGNALMGAAPRHPIIKRLLDSIKPGPGDNDQKRITSSTGPVAYTKLFFSTIVNFRGKAVIFPPSYFYPFTLSEHYQRPAISCEEMKKYIHPESMAIHYWMGSWIEKNNSPLFTLKR